MLHFFYFLKKICDNVDLEIRFLNCYFIFTLETLVTVQLFVNKDQKKIEWGWKETVYWDWKNWMKKMEQKINNLFWGDSLFKSAADWMTKNLKQFSTWQVLPVIKHWTKVFLIFIYVDFYFSQLFKNIM